MIYDLYCPVPNIVHALHPQHLILRLELFGASFLIVVDDIARLATAGEIPLGILTAFVGAPIFLYLILTGGARRGN